MTLLCIEHDDILSPSTGLYAGTREEAEGYCSALCAKVVESIPLSERRDFPRRPGEGGLDIHLARSTRDRDDDYTISGFRLEDFLFSISAETAEQYVPQCYEQRVVKPALDQPPIPAPKPR